MSGGGGRPLRARWGRRLATWACVLAAHPALAQVALHPGTPNDLAWRGERQARGFRSVAAIYRTRPIRRGRHVHPLPLAGRRIDPTFAYRGRRWTVESYMRAYRVSGLLAIKDGRIILERYGLGRGPRDRWLSFSVAKSVTSTLLGAAIAQGRVSGLEAQVTDYIPALKGSAYQGVTVRQMLTMTSGVQWNEDYTDPRSDVSRAGFPGSGAGSMTAYMAGLPRAHPPGAVFHYDTGETDLVGVLVANAVGMPLADYASQTLWKPYGMERTAAWMTDASGRERGGCCIAMTLRDYGRFGQFVLDGGVAQGRRVLPAGWLREATRVQVRTGASAQKGYGYFWWVASPGEFDAIGIFGQAIAIFPKDRLVVVQNAAWPAPVGEELEAARTAFIAATRRAAARVGAR